MLLKIASRKSDLARLQSYTVAQELKNKYKDLEVEFLFSASFGDKNPDISLTQMPAKGVFTEDLQKGLEKGEFDLVVHSWKDLPTDLSPNSLLFTLKREDPRDVILFRKESIDQVRSKKSISILTSSPRRSHHIDPFLKNYMPFEIENVDCVEVRGNIPTRLRKLKEGQGDALIMAKAAIDRLLTAPQEEFVELQNTMRSMLSGFEFMVLPLTNFPTAAAQGALAIEVNKNNDKVISKLNDIHCEQTFKNVKRERALLKSFGGGCHQKLGMTCLTHPHGVFFSASGQSHDKNSIKKLEFSQTDINESQILYTREQSFPVTNEKRISFFKRSLLDDSNIQEKIAAKDIYVTKAYAFPKNIKPGRKVWASGPITWRRLAKQGVWVHGCSESLGETFGTNISDLSGHSLDWIKLTHDDSANISPTDYNEVHTYTLENNSLSDEQIKRIKSSENYYWMSASQFIQALSHITQSDLNNFKSKNHSCGAGNSFNVIKQHIGRSPTIHLNQESWERATLK